MSEAEVLYQVDGGVATITLNRPGKLNAIAPPMNEAVRQMMHGADEDPAVRVMVLTGAGRGFCAGADVGRLKGIAETGTVQLEKAFPFNTDVRGELQWRFTYPAGMRKPVIAAINGTTAGVGLALALFCDLRFAADSAMITTGFSKRGLVAEAGIGWRLHQLIGAGRAADMLFSLQ